MADALYGALYGSSGLNPPQYLRMPPAKPAAPIVYHGDAFLPCRPPMRKLFAKPKLKKDGTPGKVLELPPIEVLQRGSEGGHGGCVTLAHFQNGQYFRC